MNGHHSIDDHFATEAPTPSTSSTLPPLHPIRGEIHPSSAHLHPSSAHLTTNGDLHSSSSSSSEIDFDPSAPETLQERVSTLSARVRQLKRKLVEAEKEIESLRFVVRENAAKELREKVSVGIQCEVIAPEGHGWTEVTEKQEEGFSISESIRQAANKVQQSQLMDELEQRGFVYEATSGFYYDPSSGYYYDAERQLYYDGNTQTYYSYNQESGTYTAFAAAEKEAAVAEEEEEEEGEDGRGGKRRKKERKEKRDPKVEEKLREEKEKLLEGIFSLRKCREVEAKKKEEEEKRRKQKKRITEEEKRATKSKWDDDSDSSGEDDEKRKNKRRMNKDRSGKKKVGEENSEKGKEESGKKRGKEGSERRKSEVEDGEISGSSSSSCSSSATSSSEDESKKKRKRKKKKMKKKSKKESKGSGKNRKKEKTKERSRERTRNSGTYGDKGKDKHWTERSKAFDSKRNRDRSTSSSYSDDDDEGNHRQKRRDIHKGPILYNEDADKRRYANGDDNHFPPCIRVIVVESESVDIGSLFIVTKDGANIGSTKESAICVEEEGISAIQASISYDMQDRHYLITQTSLVTRDTLLNEDPLSSTASGATSITLDGYVRALRHGDVMGVGSTRLLCHVHDGMDTCDECEPGQIRAKINEALAREKAEATAPSHSSMQDWRRNEMKNLKRKFGLEKAAFEGPPPVPGEDNYSDRAEQRRKKKGSSHPSHKKTTAQGASVKKALASTNKGHQLLSKMGWSEGKGLGKADQGIVEPIQVGVRSANAGLGSESSLTKSMDEPEVTQKEKARLKAQQRFADILAQEDPTS